MAEIEYKRIALIGLGLIASSLGWALRRADFEGEIIGYARSKETRRIAGELGFCDRVAPSAHEAVIGADLVILCVPVGAMAEIISEIGPSLEKGATVSDVGSVKQAVIDMVCPHLPSYVDFVPAHPLAGTEKSGPRSGFATLFDNRWCIITPLPGGEKAPIARLEKFWKALGAHSVCMDAQHHDLVLAVTSHVPHLIAYTMVGVADDLGRVSGEEIINYSAAGFRDFTRIAASDPTMWRDVFLNNKSATLEILGRFTEELFALQRAVQTSDGEALFDYFTRTRTIRRDILEAGQDTLSPDFGRAQITQES